MSGFSAPQVPTFSTDAAKALAAASQAMAAIAESPGNRSANNSRGRDGDSVIYNDISQVFDKVTRCNTYQKMDTPADIVVVLCTIPGQYFR